MITLQMKQIYIKQYKKRLYPADEEVKGTIKSLKSIRLDRLKVNIKKLLMNEIIPTTSRFVNKILESRKIV